MSKNINLQVPTGFECKELKVLLSPIKKIPLKCPIKPKPKPKPNLPPIADVEINNPWDIYDHRADQSKMPNSIDYKGYRYEITHMFDIPEGFSGAGTKQRIHLPPGFSC